MAEVNFYLKKPESSTGKSLIYLQFKYNGNRLVFSFNEKIDSADWNAKKQRVKGSKKTTADGLHSLNDLLDNLAKVCMNAYYEEKKNGIPRPERLKLHLQNFLNQNSNQTQAPMTLFGLIDRFISGEIKSRGKDKSKGTLQNYRAVKKHLETFALKYRCRVDFDTIDLDFFYKYTHFLKTIGLSQNTIAKDIRLLKVFMAEAVDLEYTDNQQFRKKKFSVSEAPTDAVYLSEKEILALYRFDLSANKRLEQVRDLFVFGCFTGLRFSDYSNVSPENIVPIDRDYFIKLITAKTKELVIVPTNPIIMDIFRKYERNANRLPKSLSNQKFNEYIKEACREAGFTEKGRLATAPELELWQCISSHTARRSFATNLYLEGFPVIDLMKITGHKTEKAFLKYIRISKLDTAKRLNEHIKKNWSSKILKAAS